MTLNFIFLLPVTPPAQWNQFEISYSEASGVPIPVIGDIVAQQGSGQPAYSVWARTYVYNGPMELTIYFACK